MRRNREIIEEVFSKMPKHPIEIFSLIGLAILYLLIRSYHRFYEVI